MLEWRARLRRLRVRLLRPRGDRIRCRARASLRPPRGRQAGAAAVDHRFGPDARKLNGAIEWLSDKAAFTPRTRGEPLEPQSARGRYVAFLLVDAGSRKLLDWEFSALPLFGRILDSEHVSAAAFPVVFDEIAP